MGLRTAQPSLRCHQSSPRAVMKCCHLGDGVLLIQWKWIKHYYASKQHTKNPWVQLLDLWLTKFTSCKHYPRPRPLLLLSATRIRKMHSCRENGAYLSLRCTVTVYALVQELEQCRPAAGRQVVLSNGSNQLCYWLLYWFADITTHVLQQLSAFTNFS